MAEKMFKELEEGRIYLLRDQYEDNGITHILVAKEPLLDLEDVINQGLSKRQEFEADSGLDPDSDSLWITDEIQAVYGDKVTIIEAWEEVYW